MRSRLVVLRVAFGASLTFAAVSILVSHIFQAEYRTALTKDQASLVACLDLNGRLTLCGRKVRFDIAETSGGRNLFSNRGSGGGSFRNSSSGMGGGFDRSSFASSGLDIEGAKDWRRSTSLETEEADSSSRPTRREYAPVRELTRRETPLEDDDDDGREDKYRSAAKHGELLEKSTWRRETATASTAGHEEEEGSRGGRGTSWQRKDVVDLEISDWRNNNATASTHEEEKSHGKTTRGFGFRKDNETSSAIDEVSTWRRDDPPPSTSKFDKKPFVPRHSNNPASSSASGTTSTEQHFKEKRRPATEVDWSAVRR